jgi:CheY-like chemotaxis protein
VVPAIAAAPIAAPGPPPAPHLAAATPFAAAGAAGQSFITCPGCGLKFVVINAASTAAATPPSVVASPPATITPAPHVAARAAAAAPAGPGASAKTILVAEDVEYFAALARSALEKKYRTLTVASVADALRVIGSEPIDLLILDLTLQGEDGRQVLRSLKGKRFPVLIFTARDESDMYGEAWKELQSLGADDMLIKGMNVEETLLQKVGILLTKP